jgi:putative CRISPR-associated protein (TIGR02619 family)
LSRVIMCTVGTSLISTWERRTHTDQPPGLSDLVDLISADEECCTESNSLSHLSLNPVYDYLYLLGSETEEGKLCCAALEEYYTQKGFRYVFPIVIRGLNSNYNDFQERGLPNLVKEMSVIYENHPGKKCVINATGGYKGQTSYATLFGIVMGIEVVYIYQDFKSIISFPEMPLIFNRDLINEYSEVFSMIVSTESANEARKLIKTLPKSLHGFFEKKHNGYDYSPVGRIFLAALNSSSHTKKYAIRTYKNHTSLWGDGINDIESIDNPDVRLIFRRIFDASESVSAVFLDEMRPGNSSETYMEYVETFPGALRYLLHTSQGSEFIKVEVVAGHERTTLERLGRKIYP